MKSKGLLLQLLAANGGRIAAVDIQKALIELRDAGLVVEDFAHKGTPRYTTHHITYDWTLTDDGRKYIKNVEGMKERAQLRGELKAWELPALLPPTTTITSK